LDRNEGTTEHARRRSNAMRLTDVMSNLGLGIYPILALPLFIGVFVGVVMRVSKRSRRSELHRAGGLPLEEGELVSRGAACEQASRSGRA
jgi:hypothetical protein